MAIPLTSESAPAPAALVDGDQTLIVQPCEGDPKLAALVREADDSEVKRGMAVAGRGRKRRGPSTAALPAATALSFTSTSKLPDVWRGTLGAC